MNQQPQRIVVKVGTSTVTRESGAPNLQFLDHLARVLVDLKNTGCQVILVSSGAIAVGTDRLGLHARPDELEKKQAVAAVGQCELIHLYDKLLSEYGCNIAQILLTDADIQRDESRKHLSDTFNELLNMGCIPVVNANDSISTEEIETSESKVLGDNDSLSAQVAELCNADLLILLTDIDGLYTADPRKNNQAMLIESVDKLTPELLEMAGGAGSWRGTGGMATKLCAAKMAMESGIDMIIANGKYVESLYDIIDGKPVGTRFVSVKD